MGDVERNKGCPVIDNRKEPCRVHCFTYYLAWWLVQGDSISFLFLWLESTAPLDPHPSSDFGRMPHSLHRIGSWCFSNEPEVVFHRSPSDDGILCLPSLQARGFAWLDSPCPPIAEVSRLSQCPPCLYRTSSAAVSKAPLLLEWVARHRRREWWYAVFSLDGTTFDVASLWSLSLSLSLTLFGSVLSVLFECRGGKKCQLMFSFAMNHALRKPQSFLKRYMKRKETSRRPPNYINRKKKKRNEIKVKTLKQEKRELLNKKNGIPIVRDICRCLLSRMEFTMGLPTQWKPPQNPTWCSWKAA